MKNLFLLILSAFSFSTMAQDSSVECSATFNGNPTIVTIHVWESTESFIHFSEWKTLDDEVFYEYVATNMKGVLKDINFMNDMTDLGFLTYNKVGDEVYFSKSRLLIDKVESEYKHLWDFSMIYIDSNDEVINRYEVEVKIGTCKMISGIELSDKEEF